MKTVSNGCFLDAVLNIQHDGIFWLFFFFFFFFFCRKCRREWTWRAKITRLTVLHVWYVWCCGRVWYVCCYGHVWYVWCYGRVVCVLLWSCVVCVMPLYWRLASSDTITLENYILEQFKISFCFKTHNWNNDMEMTSSYKKNTMI